MANVQLLCCWCASEFVPHLCCFPLFPTVSPDLSWPPPSAAEITTQHPPLYLQLICIWGSNKDNDWENHTCISRQSTPKLELNRRQLSNEILDYFVNCILCVECESPYSLLSDCEGISGHFFVLTLIARSRQQKPCNPTAITTRLIDSTGTERQTEKDQVIDKEGGEKVDLCYCVLHRVYHLIFRRVK